MTTTLESQPIEFQKEKGVYHAVLTNNGTLEVYVLSLNGMQAQDIEHIAVLDDTPPSFDEESVVIENGKLITHYRRQHYSGINYDSSMLPMTVEPRSFLTAAIKKTGSHFKWKKVLSLFM